MIPSKDEPSRYSVFFAAQDYWGLSPVPSRAVDNAVPGSCGETSTYTPLQLKEHTIVSTLAHATAGQNGPHLAEPSSGRVYFGLLFYAGKKFWKRWEYPHALPHRTQPASQLNGMATHASVSTKAVGL